jgi:hypothetical protein
MLLICIESCDFKVIYFWFCLDRVTGEGYWELFTVSKLRAQFSCDQHGLKDSFMWNSSKGQVDLKVGSDMNILYLIYSK